MNTITIELCAEDRARLDNILAALKDMTLTPCFEAEPLKPFPQEEQTQEAPAPAEEPQNSAGTPQNSAGTPQEAPAPTPAETVPEVDTATLQSKVVQLVNAGKRDEAKAIILEYAPCVSQVPAEKRAEALARLCKLEG